MDQASSISSNSVLIACLGFEERYVFGLMRTISSSNPNRIILFCVKDQNSALTDKNLRLTQKIAASCGINLDKVEIGSSYEEASSAIRTAIETIDVRSYRCIFDLTTVPRRHIFPIIRTLEKHLGFFYYIYNDPGLYDDAPFLKEFTTPSPIMGASGIPDLDKKLCSIIITGYDADITRRIIESSDADLIYLGVQKGKKLENTERNIIPHRNIISCYSNVNIFEIDSFSGNNGFDEIDSIIKGISGKYNIEISSFGPKLSYISLYKISKKYPEVCINDIQTEKISPPYSIGIGIESKKIFKEIELSSFDYGWLPGNEISSQLLQECSELFSAHYGHWGDLGLNPGKPVKMSPDRLKDYINGDNSWIAFAKDEDRLIAYAFCQRFETTQGNISLITQLVVHTDYRKQGIATRILNSIWGFSDHFAWGLATASPFAVRALEKATRRRVLPDNIAHHLSLLKDIARQVFYYSGKEITVTSNTSTINTEFYVDHESLTDNISKASVNSDWLLSTLGEGEEWLAVTFREQRQMELSHADMRALFSSSDATVIQAYQRMTMTDEHHWTGATSSEVDFIIEEFGLNPGDAILDLGCGRGRHSIELAKRGLRVTCVDFVQSNIDFINEQIKNQKLANITPVCDDCRTLKLNRRFNYIICLYDVIGSFANDTENSYIINTIANHLEQNGKVLISVMNLELSKNMAKNKTSVFSNLDALFNLPPSNTMEKTGNIFNPDYYLFDDEDLTFYRKEKFEVGSGLPCELIVRDKRYNKETIERMCINNSICKKWSRYVAIRDWKTEIDALDNKAKELLFCGTKE